MVWVTMSHPLAKAGCEACGGAPCRFAATSIPALAELVDLGDPLAARHLAAREAVVHRDVKPANVSRPQPAA